MNFNKTNNINNKNINKNEDIIFRKLNLKKNSSKGFMQLYRNNNAHMDTKYLHYNKIIKNKTIKNENPFSIDSKYNSKIDFLRQKYIKNNYEMPIPNLKRTNPLKNIKNNTRTSLQAKTLKGKTNNFFNEYDFSNLYFPPKNNLEEKGKNNLKEYRIGLLSAGSTSYNSVIIPMISLKRQSSSYFIGNENDKNFGINDTTKTKKNFISYIKKTILSGKCKQNQKVRNLSSYVKKHVNEDFKDVEKLIPKFHKIKIEKGMMDSRLAKTLRDNFVENYYKNRKYQVRNRLKFIKSFNREKAKNIYNDIDL